MKVAILTPLFNDWESLGNLLLRIDRLPLPNVSELRVVVINDGSSMPAPPDLTQGAQFSRISAVVLLDLTCNLGHQRAIALGLAALAAEQADDVVVVMDSDGEDEPDDVPRLIAACCDQPGAVVVAERSKRSEGVTFRLGYQIYRIVFRLLTGRRIRFGNFCAMGIDVADRLANTPNAWNHLAATLLRSGLPIIAIPSPRARRFAGTPSTNFVSLLAHGLSALAVFSDYVFARLLLVSAVLAGIAMVGGAIVIFVRFSTDLAIPGWATEAVGIFAIVFIQALLLFLIGAVQLMATRNQAGAVPAKLIDIFVHRRREIFRGRG
jgi:glycosyltransferase involved in cell wall biosynthesis